MKNLLIGFIIGIFVSTIGQLAYSSTDSLSDVLQSLNIINHKIDHAIGLISTQCK